MKRYKLIALDLDGTLLRDDLTISSQSRTWIQKAEQAGIVVCFSTGRSRSSSEEYWHVVSPEAPMVVLNGAEVWRNHQELLSRHSLPWEAIAEFYALARRHGARIWANTSELSLNDKDWSAHYLETEEWLKFGMVHPDPEQITDLRRQAAELGPYEVTGSTPTNLEITELGVSKASGLAEVAALLGISSSEVAVIGDSDNDLAMLRWAGFGAAMGNAEDQIKKEADYVAASNEDEGVAEVIRLILK